MAELHRLKWSQPYSYVLRKYKLMEIQEEQTTQWPKEKVQKDKQRSTKDYT
jgi:hypothetical protein